MKDSSPRTGDFEVGRVVAERYEILGAIGQGTSGTVYRARDLYVDSAEEIVALKAIHAHLHSDRQIFGRFKREVKILRAMEGPNLCKLLDCVEEDGLLLIVLEHIDGPALDDYVRDQGELPLSEIVAIMTQVCNALAVAHAANVVHRDLKPSNVLIEGIRRAEASSDEQPMSFLRDLKVRVVDFGLAKMVAGDMTGTALTEMDMIFGTPDYMSPEQVAGDELDSRCDIYAAGVMLYELVVGQVPFDTPSALTTMAAHMNAPVPSPRQAAPERNISVLLERCILKALSKDKNARHATARDLANELSHITDEVEVQDEDTADSDLAQSKTSISTTMESHKNEAIAARERGAKVKVVVREAVPSREPPPPTSATGVSSRLGAGDGERRIWTAVAVIAALVAVLAGVWLGVR